MSSSRVVEQIDAADGREAACCVFSSVSGSGADCSRAVELAAFVVE